MNEQQARTMIGKKVTYYGRELEVLDVVPQNRAPGSLACFKILLEDCNFTLAPVADFEIQNGKVVRS